MLLARILEWIAIPFSTESSEIEPGSPALQADSLPFELQGRPCGLKMGRSSKGEEGEE